MHIAPDFIDARSRLHLQYCALHKQVTAVAAALRAGSSGPESGEAQEAEDADSSATSGAWAHLTAARRAELLRRGSEAIRQLAALRKEFGNRQRLVSGVGGCCKQLAAVSHALSAASTAQMSYQT